MKSSGLSIIEILVVVTIIVLFMVVAFPRFQEMNATSSYHKDITYLMESIGRARALVEATNSESCAADILNPEKLGSIDIVRVGANGYQMVSYCVDKDTGAGSYESDRVSFSLLSSEFDTADSDETFVTMGTDGTFSPGGAIPPGSAKGFQVVRGTRTCTVTISSAGTVSTSGADCP